MQLLSSDPGCLHVKIVLVFKNESLNQTLCTTMSLHTTPTDTNSIACPFLSSPFYPSLSSKMFSSFPSCPFLPLLFLFSSTLALRLAILFCTNYMPIFSFGFHTSPTLSSCCLSCSQCCHFLVFCSLPRFIFSRCPFPHLYSFLLLIQLLLFSFPTSPL